MSAITHARFAERLCYLSSHITSWAGSCLTLPDEHDKPMRVWSVQRFIEEIQSRIDFLKEDLAELQALESSGQSLADATPKIPQPGE